MRPLFLTPHPALQPYIRHYAYCEMGTTNEWTPAGVAPAGSVVTPIAVGCRHILLKEYGRYEPVGFGGQITEFRKMLWYGRVKIFFAFFQPCGAYQLLSISQKECADLFANLSDVLGSSVKAFCEEVTDQTSPEGVLSKLSMEKKKE